MMSTQKKRTEFTPEQKKELLAAFDGGLTSVRNAELQLKIYERSTVILFRFTACMLCKRSTLMSRHNNFQYQVL